MLGKVLNKVGGLFGLGGGQGEFYQAPQFQSQAMDTLNDEIALLKNPRLNGIMNDYAQGKMTLEQAMQHIQDGGGNLSAGLGQMSTSPIVGSMVASDQVRNDPLSKGLLGQGGALERALAEEKDLASRGYSLQPEDHEAYGQASGNIARMFGQKEQSLAQALADRGLSAAGSGVANQEFSGLYGNKFEQLGQMQRQIADDRMNRNMQRLQQTRSFAMGLGGLGQDALNSQFNRNLAGQESRQGNLQNMYGKDLQKYGMEQSAAQASMASKKANEKSSLADAVGKGIFSGVQGGLSGFLSGIPISSGSGLTTDAGEAGGTTQAMRRKGVLG